MADWQKIIVEHFEAYYQADNNLLASDGASIEDVQLLQESLGVNLPDEFHSLYLQSNGFGVIGKSDDREYWFFRPLCQIQELSLIHI